MSCRKVLLTIAIAASIPSCGTEPTLSDTTTPWRIGDLTVRTTREGFYLHWTATGDDNYEGHAVHYDVRYATNNLGAGWDSAHIVPNLPTPSAPRQADSVSVLGIGVGPWEFGVRIGDDAGNWSQLSNIVVASIDTIPPAAITDLAIRSTNRGFYLRWTASGDDGSQGHALTYDIRYASSGLANNWETANVVQSLPTPAAAGHPDSMNVLGIGTGPWEFGIRSVDEGGNWSPLSNVVTTTISDDAVPPAPVTDLSVDLITGGSVVLRWTASGDDGTSGQASAYDIRYAESPITPETWAGASSVSGPNPHPSEERELFTVPGLQSGTTYYFALVVIDDVENRSDPSNSPMATISTAVQITHYPYSAFDPDWSPNGQFILYNSQAEIQPGVIRSELFVVPAGGGGPVRYTSSPDGATQASWSPDGSRIAFRLYVDGNRKVLGMMDAQPEAQPQVVADHSEGAVSGPRWSPDGTHIAYVVTGASVGQPAGSVMYTVPSSGGAPELLAGDYTWVVSGLDWSPDGTQIAYSSNQTGKHHICWIAATGGVPSQLTNGLGNESTPAWAPDGSRIAYVVDQPQEIRVIYANGDNPTRVTFDQNNLPYRKVTWSPDGKMIAYGAAGTSSGITNLWRLPLK